MPAIPHNILPLKRNRRLINIQGPPGTGKSQDVASQIATAAAEGKSFVSSREAACVRGCSTRLKSKDFKI